MSYQWSQRDGAEEFPLFIHHIKEPGMLIPDHGINYFFNARFLAHKGEISALEAGSYFPHFYMMFLFFWIPYPLPFHIFSFDEITSQGDEGEPNKSSFQPPVQGNFKS
jgi:hypothetical protein